MSDLAIDSERQLIDRLAAKQAACIAETHTVEPEQLPVRAVMEWPQERQEAADAKRERLENYERTKKIDKATKSLRRELGRFANADETKFEVYHRNQDAVLETLREIYRDIDEFVSAGRGLILYGAVGTGKDHLMASLLLRAAKKGHRASWVDCRTLWGRIASSWREEKASPQQIMDELAGPKVLCLSDPVSQTNEKETRRDALNQIISRRYDAGKPTWVTANLANEEAAARLFGEDVWSRLVQDSVLLETRWPDYRKRTKSTPKEKK